MINWGLGIEHEMRVRFSNKIDILNIDDENIKVIYEKFGYIPEYLFINSNFVLNLYNNYIKLLLKDYKNENKKNAKINKSNPYIILDKLIKEKKEFPFDDINFYNEEYLYYYFNNYKKTHFKFLNLFIYFYNEYGHENNYLSPSRIYDNWSIISSLDKENIKKHFLKLMDETYEDEYINLLKKNLKLFKYNKLEIEDDIIFIKIDKNDKSSPIINFNLLKKKIFMEGSNDMNIDKIEFISKFKNNKELLQLLKKISDNGIPHIDSSSKTSALEFKTYDYKNKNYKTMLDNLINIENTFFQVVNEIPELSGLINKYGKITYHHTGSLNKTIVLNNLTKDFTEIKKDYAGSYHVWITIPYSEKETPETFINKHANLANRLQLLEPIFASYFTSPDIEAIGNNLTHSRSSLRHFLNNYSGYGTSDILLLYGKKKHTINSYYLSKDDVIDNNKIKVYFNQEIYDNHNKIVKNYDALMGRSATSKNFKFFMKKYTNGNNNTNTNINDYMMQIFKSTKIRPLKDEYNSSYLPLGADIRTSDLNKLFYPPVENNYEKIYILENNKFNLYYYDKVKKIVTQTPEYNMESYKKMMKDERIGIEFRIFDHFPTYNMIQFLAILAQIVSYTTVNYNIITNKDIYANQQFWHDEMAKSILNGFEYNLEGNYIKNIEKEFSVKISNKKINGEEFFNIFYENMDKKLIKNKIYKKIKISNKDFQFENFNEKVWRYNFLLYLKNNMNILNEIRSVLKSESNNIQKKESILKILGDNFKYDIEKIYKTLKLFTK